LLVKSYKGIPSTSLWGWRDN